MNDLDLDLRIDAEHKKAERAEEDARKIAARLRLIPGASQIVGRKRGYGTLGALNPWADGHQNLSAQAAITRADTALAHYLARQAGKSLPAADDAALERERQRAESVARMQAETERMRSRNSAQRQRQAWEATHGSYNSFLGQWQ
ncbi:MAG: hypothetical protein EBV32_02530 [Proteobacteria bacterium]|uniref:Uncharacterized protein n=1 Tax=Candidatus Fonsibacter lacus TaxID=2576439 RepID=A0A964UZM3_9PROT|nr:hypothetical protein [Candidatus Fonsibacter lacus]NBP59904.1 hypothetical protein [Pseudomonadota bacterium]NCU71948.1 hypothetical protein [Candidatus Fonsibacter lacus]